MQDFGRKEEQAQAHVVVAEVAGFNRKQAKDIKIELQSSLSIK